ncbi:hypothetical protein BDF19DRAFT_446819 [Syncephalis fuscata]|nr:hypothetical protein BDF19DRAFT_446819 [Syncephalis fuscata]
MSLADELLADLDDLGNDLDEAGSDDNLATDRNAMADGEDGLDVDQDELWKTMNPRCNNNHFEREAEETERRINQLVASAKSIHDVAKLLRTRTVMGILQRIGEFTQQQATAASFAGPVEHHPEYTTIVQANNLTADVDNEILAVHKFIRDHYAARFPELESLVLNPYDYVQTVKAIGNAPDLANLSLDTVLPSATIMVVRMAGSTTRGRLLSEEEWQLVDEACTMALSLDEARSKILNYVESRMQLIAPNLSAIIGTSTAAKMMGAAGGLTALSKMPACNIQVLGASAKARTGFSNIGMQRHAGFIYYSELISRIPLDLRTKATRIVAAKIRKRLEKMQEPAPNKNTRALPAPIEAAKKKRGGRRVRKQKEAYELTELRRQQNRVHFNALEDESFSMDESRGLGMMTKQIGRIRAAVAESRTKTNVSNAMQRRLKTYGLGIELENPEARAQKLQQLNSRYFDGAQGFLQVKRKRTTMEKEDANMDKTKATTTPISIVTL